MRSQGRVGGPQKRTSWRAERDEQALPPRRHNRTCTFRKFPVLGKPIPKIAITRLLQSGSTETPPVCLRAVHALFLSLPSPLSRDI